MTSCRTAACGRQGKGAVSAPRKAVETRGKGSVLATETVGTQDKGSVLPVLGTSAGSRLSRLAEWLQHRTAKASVFGRTAAAGSRQRQCLTVPLTCWQSQVPAGSPRLPAAAACLQESERSVERSVEGHGRGSGRSRKGQWKHNERQWKGQGKGSGRSRKCSGKGSWKGRGRAVEKSRNGQWKVEEGQWKVKGGQ